MSSIIEESKDIVNTVETAMACIDKQNMKEVQKWIKICSQNIRSIKKTIKNAENAEIIDNLQCAVKELMGYRTILKAALVRGGGCQPTRAKNVARVKNQHKLKDLKSPFYKRIRSGCSNLTQKDRIKLLEDCGYMLDNINKQKLKEKKGKKPTLTFETVMTNVWWCYHCVLLIIDIIQIVFHLIRTILQF